MAPKTADPRRIPTLDAFCAMRRPRTVDELLEKARATLRRMTPTDARRAAAEGALIIDTSRAWRVAGLPTERPRA